MSCFSPEIASVHAFFTDDTIGIGALLPEEAALTASFAGKRIRDFTTGRHCARMALRGLGLSEAMPIPVGEAREPCWPEGVTGSISHAEGLTGSMVAWTRDYRSIGLDIERYGAVEEALLPLVLTPNELEWVGGDTALATVIFSLKEAFYKMQFPLIRQFLDFREVETDSCLSRIRVLKEYPDIGHRTLGHRIWQGHVITWALAT
jgi:4'-phosphopantetheinyl transferase EntD